MANFNTYMFIAEATKQVADCRTSIEGSGSYEEGKNEARKMLGFLDGMCIFLNTMDRSHSSDGCTEDLDELIDSWMAGCYESLAELADKTQQPADIVAKLFKMRDGYMNN